MIDVRTAGGQCGSWIEFESDEIDRPIRRKKAVHGDGTEESPSGDKHPSRRNPSDDLGQGLEASREALNEDRQVNDEEVGGRWFTVLASIGTELPLQVLEERRRDAYYSPISRHHCVERPSRAPRGYGTTKEVPTAADDNEIFVRVSSDGGATWSDRITINDDASRVNTQHYDPGISIAPNGRVDVAWYDFRNSAEPEKLPVEFAAPFNVGGFNDVYYSSSTDGGRTWSENTRISDRLIDRNIVVWSNNVHSHYNVGIASTNDLVYFAWQDSRAGNAVTNAEDVYFASLKLDPDDILVGASSGTTSAWPLAIAGVMLGMGIAMVLAFLVTRRRPTPQQVSS